MLAAQACKEPGTVTNMCHPNVVEVETGGFWGSVHLESTSFKLSESSNSKDKLENHQRKHLMVTSGLSVQIHIETVSPTPIARTFSFTRSRQCLVQVPWCLKSVFIK